MHNLVVCGATDAENPAHAELFSDFMGISMALRNLHPDIQGTFLSCFPLDKHFDVLEQRKPPITDTYFGCSGPDNKPLYTYSKNQWALRQDKWFEEVDKEELLARVFLWMLEKARCIERDDVVNMFFACQGTHEHDLEVGTRVFSTQDFAEVLQLFRADVQVNAVGRHCYSGCLVGAVVSTKQRGKNLFAGTGPDDTHWWGTVNSWSNRIRYFQFGQPFVQSLARVQLPGIPQQVLPPVTEENHDEFISEAILRSVGGTSAPTPPTASYLSPEQSYAISLIERLILMDYVDVNYDRDWTYRRRRNEFPTMDLSLHRNQKIIVKSML
ncbi:hypothetical protein L228DRAFT_59207 [Xylona heveae TC161]|uniref:Uncharacterized protein n=1 Tax=Xylona heveae (strain CBS 132557 / TC161) TaxID=1328760 RepID=A0A165IJ42_XYLHT|nr:hypothetical protein L228DRAFT_59207 [Xylona heveae TC161]KZF24965.1 hypothetical protein L228DRAFT_59207 [Xylona heveae TC161]